jgi:hypothetical protein
VRALRARYAVLVDPLRSERRVELALLGCGLLLLLLVLYFLVRVAVATDIDAIAPAPDSVRVASLSRSGVPPVEDREAIVSRPLFWAERQPVEPVVTPEAVAAAEKGKPEKAAPRMKEVTVSGVYGSGETGGVILSVKQRQLRLAVGEEVDGWRLERVTANSAVFTSGGVRDERELLAQVIEVSSASAGSGAGQNMPAVTQPVSDAGGEAGAGEEEQLTLGGVR